MKFSTSLTEMLEVIMTADDVNIIEAQFYTTQTIFKTSFHTQNLSEGEK